MSNFSAFDKKHSTLLLEPFAPGMAEHITPIKYEALTPDSFLLLFRTTARDGRHHYFVSLETDFQNSLEGARCTIEDWHGNEVIAFWPLQDKKSLKPSDDIQDFRAPTDGPYFALLAEVKQPTHKGYWANAITIMPGDTIGDKIKDFTEKAQQNIRKALAEVLKHKTDPTASFLDSYAAQKKDTMRDDINQTDMAVTLYVQPDDSVELFYAYVNQTVGNRPRKTKGHTPIVAIARREVWEQALKTGEYTQSTIKTTLAEVGFIHCSFPDQTIDIANRHFKDEDDLVLLLIDEGKVKAQVKHEGALSGRAGTFPHIYGPLNVDAVYSVLALQKDATGTFTPPVELKELQN